MLCRSLFVLFLIGIGLAFIICEKNARNITLEGLSLFALVIFRAKHDLLFRFYSTFA